MNDQPSSAPWPVELRLRRAARRLEIDFDDGAHFELPAALLRAMTPSAAERGHTGGADHPLAKDFSTVALIGAQPVGAYAVRLSFNDGHDSGLYTWAALHRIGRERIKLEAEHARLIARAGASLPRPPGP